MTKNEKSTTINAIINYAKSMNILEDLKEALAHVDASTSVDTHTDASAPTHVEAPTRKSAQTKTRKSAQSKTTKSQSNEVRTYKFMSDKKFVTYTNEDGTYLAHKGVRQVLNSRIREMGGEWNKDAKAWEFKSAKSAKKCVDTINRTVTQDDLAPVFAKWAEKSAK